MALDMRNALAEGLRPMATGAAFGAALTASRVYLPTVIIDQMRFKDFHMLEVFLTASASSALIIHAFDRLGIAKKCVRPNSTLNWFSVYDGNILGGTLLGIGMSLTGACPGTVLPQLAHGVSSSYSTFLGGLVGGGAHAWYHDNMKKAETGPESNRPAVKHTIAAKFAVSPGATLLVFETLVAAAISFSSLVLPGKEMTMVSTTSGGLLIGLAQTVSILLTSNPLGTSAAYEQAARYIAYMLGHTQMARSQTSSTALFNATGILVGSLVLRLLGLSSSLGTMQTSVARGVLGGFLLVFGARIAGGCTSGHGLSGLSALSYSSLITTMAMFGAGAALQMFLKGY